MNEINFEKIFLILIIRYESIIAYKRKKNEGFVFEFARVELNSN